MSQDPHRRGVALTEPCRLSSESHLNGEIQATNTRTQRAVVHSSPSICASRSACQMRSVPAAAVAATAVATAAWTASAAVA